jgi:hypothetical protein
MGKLSSYREGLSSRGIWRCEAEDFGVGEGAVKFFSWEDFAARGFGFVANTNDVKRFPFGVDFFNIAIPAVWGFDVIVFLERGHMNGRIKARSGFERLCTASHVRLYCNCNYNWRRF